MADLIGWLIGFLVLVGGGFLLGRRSGPSPKAERELERERKRRLEEAREHGQAADEHGRRADEAEEDMRNHLDSGTRDSSDADERRRRRERALQRARDAAGHGGASGE